ncbi:hypothetical protein [Halolamina salifodinae]|uniref:Uncharacterized protein n=1 Tax=Halolamina salifodinae TaxID=1202767 RepID=A0A8T4GU60_9EURY|nr:hypothetical protein [Halolamina salifodinae]MBP1985930.1 hypothetical protein [Halolamina salifodinae]
MSKAASKVVGEIVEDLVFEDVDELQTADVPESWGRAAEDYWHDAIPEVALFASKQIPMVGMCVIEPGQPVEIKAARATISNGSRSRCGRFYITRRQHEKLVETGGVYLFVIYGEDDDGDEELLGLLAVPAVIVEEELRPTWYEVDGRSDYYQLSADALPIDGLGGEAA